MSVILNQPKAIFFDLDGTIIDSIELIIRCFQHTVSTHLGFIPHREEILKYIGIPLKTELERLAPGQGHNLIETYREMQFALHDELVTVYDGIDTLITDLDNSEIALGIVTSKAKAGTNMALKLLGNHAALFKVVVTVEDVKNHKPHPEPLLHAASLLKLNPKECWYIGDTRHDMNSARAASMRPIGVSWGVESAEVMRSYTEHVVTHPSEIFALLSL